MPAAGRLGSSAPSASPLPPALLSARAGASVLEEELRPGFRAWVRVACHLPCRSGGRQSVAAETGPCRLPLPQPSAGRAGATGD